MEACVFLQRTVFAFTFAEDRRSGNGHLHDVAFEIVGQHHSHALAETAGACVTLARTLLVIRASGAGRRALVLDGGVGLIAVCAPACWGRYVVFVKCAFVKGAGHLGGCVDDHQIEVALVHCGDFFAGRNKTEHAALDRDTLTLPAAAREGLRNGRQLALGSERWTVGSGIENSDLVHDGVLSMVTRSELLMKSANSLAVANTAAASFTTTTGWLCTADDMATWKRTA